MGIFSRFSDIINANLHSLLDKAEDPEKMVRLIIQEMEDTLVEVRSTAARTIADRKTVAREMERVRAEMNEWASKAELAVSRDREDLARAALVEKNRAEERVTALEREDQELGQQLDKLNEDIRQLQAKLEDARNRQKSLVQRRKVGEHRLSTRRQVHDRRLDDALARFEGYEQRLDRVEGEAEALDMGREPGLHAEFEALESEDKVTAELAELKARVHGEPASSGKGKQAKGSGTKGAAKGGR